MKLLSSSNNSMFRYIFFGLSLLAIASVAILFSVNNNQNAGAIKATDFKDGNIISDSVFYNKNAMSVQQIQDFLNRLIPTCLTWNSQTFVDAGGTLVGAPYVCLNNYHENPITGETSFEKGGGAFPGGQSAAQIIYDASQKYGINPQVLLVMLKKESLGPITSDNWPTKWQYKYAMGYACPDSGPNNSANCDDKKAGFYKQVNLAAWQLNYYKEHPNDYRYSLGWNNIQYSPNAACGTKRVYIENIATLSLYIYTPYVPNDAALANYPGTSNCGAYGNRNFFMFFSEWFGRTDGPSSTAVNAISNTLSQFKSKLGLPTSELIVEHETDGRVWQSYQGGLIIWTPAYGSHAILNGPINDRWRSLGGSIGTLGVPTGSETLETDDNRVWQSFERGTVIWSSSTGAWEVQNGPISDKWRVYGGSRGELGKPTSTVIINENGVRTQNFENGSITRRNSLSTPYTVIGSIHMEWSDSKPTTGTPTMDAVREDSDGRVWQNFENSLIITPAKNSPSWSIRHGDIHAKWSLSGGSNGSLGKPVSNQFTEKDGRIWQQFERGHIIKKSRSTEPSVILFGHIYSQWRATGGSTGSLGVPKGQQHTEPDGRIWQDFDNGTIIWSNKTGAWDVAGGFYTFWRSKGGSLGSLGKPTGSRVIESNGLRWQSFEKAKAIWSDTTGWSVKYI